MSRFTKSVSEQTVQVKAGFATDKPRTDNTLVYNSGYFKRKMANNSYAKEL